MLDGLKELLEKHKGTELTVDQFEEELNKILPKKWKPADTFNELNEKYKALEKQNADYAKAIEEANKNKTSVEDLNKQIESLKEQHKAETEKRDAEFAEYKKNAFIESALEKAGALSVKASKALLDTSKITLSDKGEYIGFDEQIESIKKDNAFLFKATEGGKPSFGNGGGAGNPPSSTAEAEIAKAMGL